MAFLGLMKNMRDTNIDISNIGGAHIQTPPPVAPGPVGDSSPFDILVAAYNGPISTGQTIVLYADVSSRVYNTLYIVGQTAFTGALLIGDQEVLQLDKTSSSIEGIVLVGLRQLTSHTISVRIDEVNNTTANFDIQACTIKI